VRYTILIVGLLLLLVPLLVGCELKPEDQWPVIAGWQVTANLDCAAKLDKKTNIVTLTLPASTAINLKIDVRTYNANQAFKVTVINQSLRRDFMTGEPPEYFPFYWTQGDPTVPSTLDWIHAGYVTGSGRPPQGLAEITLGYSPAFPTSLSDWWLGGTTVVNRYSWSFLVIVEDAGGRTDTFEFSEASNMKLTVG